MGDSGRAANADKKKAGGTPPGSGLSEFTRFLVSRANPEHPDFYLVNRLISDYLPFDYMSRFVFNKPRFYRDYENWPENYRDFVVKQIRDTYLPDKKALRRRLYK